MSMKKIILTIALIALTATVGFLVLSDSPTRTSQPGFGLFTATDAPYVAAGTFTEATSSVAKTVQILSANGENVHTIAIPNSTSTLAGPPIVVDWSDNRQFLAIAANHCCENQLYIYDFKDRSLTEVPEELRVNTSIGGAEINFSPNGRYFTAVRDTQVWLGYRHDDQWQVKPLLSVLKDTGYATSSATLVSRNSTLQWRPEAPAQLLAVTSESPAASDEHYDLGFWSVDLQTGIDNPTVSKLADIHETYVKEFNTDEYFRIDGFQWSGDGSELIVHWWGPEVPPREMLLSFSDNQFVVEDSQLKTAITDSLPNERELVYRPLALNAERDVVYAHTYLSESAPASATTTPDWWAYDLTTASAQPFYAYSGTMNSSFRWSPDVSHLAVREAGSGQSLGTITVVDSTGEAVWSDKLVGYEDMRGSLEPEESSVWSADGRYLAYLKAPHYYTPAGDSGDLIRDNSLTGGEIVIYDTKQGATSTIHVSDSVRLLRRQRVSFLIR